MLASPFLQAFRDGNPLSLPNLWTSLEKRTCCSSAVTRSTNHGLFTPNVSVQNQPKALPGGVGAGVRKGVSHVVSFVVQQPIVRDVVPVARLEDADIARPARAVHRSKRHCTVRSRVSLAMMR